MQGIVEKLREELEGMVTDEVGQMPHMYSLALNAVLHNTRVTQGHVAVFKTEDSV